MIYNILDYGARADGSLCTDGIQRAIDDCFLHGGGEVVIPTGSYSVAGLRLRSNVTLHLLENAILLGSIDPEDYNAYINDTIEPISAEEREGCAPNVVNGAPVWISARPYSRWNNAIIRAINAENIAIIGERGSEINGQNCYDEQGEEDYRGPHAINMWFCKSITLRGYTVRDSANWAHAIQNSQNITVQEVTVLGGHDGFDVRTCDNVTVDGCRFLTGDDAIAGYDNVGVTVRNCYLESSCSLFRFGGTDVLIESCTGIAPATYGYRGQLSMEEKKNRASDTGSGRNNCLSIFLYYCDYRAELRKAPGNIVIRNCRFENPDTVFELPFGHIFCCNRSLSDITFENCVIEGICKPLDLRAPREEPLTFCMKNCVLTPRKGYENIVLAEGTNVRKIQLENVSLAGFTDPRILCEPQPVLEIGK